MNSNPLVSICCITYNHARYIRQCLDGFLMQKVNFEYEIIVHDDASTDGTSEIIRDYSNKYSDLIVPIFQSENQYSKGVCGVYAKFVYPHARGKYIAICEGDDYWIDPLKLQKQVDFLEMNPNYSMVHTGFCCVDENSVQMYVDKFQARLNESIDDTKKNKLNWELSRLKRALSYMSKSESGFIYYKLLATSNYIMTVSVLMRKSVVDKIPQNGLYFDYGMFLVAARLGYVGYIPDCTSSYRFTPGSIVSNPKSLRELGVKKRKLLLFEISRLLKRECCCIDDVFSFPNYKMLVSRVLVNLLRKSDWGDKIKILVLVLKNIDLYVPFLCSLIFRYDVNKLYDRSCQQYILVNKN